jgi:hypothetical protein
MRNTSTLVGLTLFALAATARAEEPAPAAPAAPPVENAAASAAAPMPEETGPASDKPGKLQVGLSFLPMAKGRYIYSPDTQHVTNAEASFAYGAALSVSYEVMNHFFVGLAPQVIFNVREKDPENVADTQAVKEYDVLARFAYVLPVTEGTSVYAEILPGYSLITNDAGAKGLVIVGGIGATMDMTDRIFVNVGAGYQVGFQTWKEGTNSYQTRTRYVRVTLGGGVRF